MLLNGNLGTTNVSSFVLTVLNNYPPYVDICHTLCGRQSTS